MGLHLIQSFRTGGIFANIAFAFLMLGMPLGWISYFSDNWGRIYYQPTDKPNHLGFGVWVVGNDSPSLLNVLPTDGWLQDWFIVFQASATVGFVTLNLGFMLSVLAICVPSCKPGTDIALWNAVNVFFGAIGWLVAVIIFQSNFDSDYDYALGENATKLRQLHFSFFFAATTLAFHVFAGIFLVLASCCEIQTAAVGDDIEMTS